MTAVGKFAVCHACWATSPSAEDAGFSVRDRVVARHQWTLTRNAIADAVCPLYTDGVVFRTLTERDNWLAQDNPFEDDDD